MYSEIVMDHFQNPRNVGKPGEFNARGVSGNPDAGPFMVLYLDIEGEGIRGAAFQTYGCGPAIAAGSLLTEMVKGRSVAEARSITSHVLLDRLGGLPLGKTHCADLAVSALRDALGQVGP